MVAAFLLFGMLDSVRVAFNSGGNVAGADRLIVASRLSITQMLPYSLAPQIALDAGVSKSAFAAWFGGIYQDPKNFFPNFSVGDELLRPLSRVSCCRRSSEGLGRPTAPAPSSAPRWPSATAGRSATRFRCRRRSSRSKGSNDWPLTLRGIFTVSDREAQGEENQLMFHWKYFDEANDFVKSRVGWFIVKLDDVNQADAVALAIDALSENSDHETKTQTESAFNQAFAKQFADIGLIVTAIMGGGVLHPAAADRQHHGAGGARAHPGAGRTQDDRLFTTAPCCCWCWPRPSLLIVLGGCIGLGIAAAADARRERRQRRHDPAAERAAADLG